MKKFILGVITVVLGLTACNSENDAILNEKTNKGMVLNATVEKVVDTRASIDDSDADWSFSFAEGDIVKVTNSVVSTYYTFTKGTTNFTSNDAVPTTTNVTWYAYFPSENIDLRNQSGTLADVANKFALVGATTTETTGEEDLSISMNAKVAIIKIINYKGTIDINVKNGPSTWVSGLTANGTGFNITTYAEKATILGTNNAGTYYIAVPAGVQLSIKDGDTTIKSTKNTGLTAGGYYTLELTPTHNGHGYVDLGLSVNWATMNVGATSSEDIGDYFAWGEKEPYYESKNPLSWKSGKTEGYDFSSYFDYDNDQNKFTTYNGEKPFLLLEHDVAASKYGPSWQMPSKTDWEELRDNCTWKWETKNGVSVCKITSNKPGYTDKFILLPASGKFSYKQLRDPERFLGQMAGMNVCGGGYWSSTFDTNGRYNEWAYYMLFTLGGTDYSCNVNIGSSMRYEGYPVRPVYRPIGD